MSTNDTSLVNESANENEREFGEGLSPYLLAFPDIDGEPFNIEDFFADNVEETPKTEKRQMEDVERQETNANDERPNNHTNIEQSQHVSNDTHLDNPVDLLAQYIYAPPPSDPFAAPYRARQSNPSREAQVQDEEYPLRDTQVERRRPRALGHSLYRDWDTSEGPIDTTRYIWQDEATRIRELTSNPWSGFEDPPPPMGYVQAPPLNPWGPYEGRMIPCVELSRKRSSMAMEGQANNIKRTRFEASTPRQSSSPFGRRFQLDGPGTGPFSPTPFTSDPFASAPRPSNRGSSHHRSNPGRATGQVIPRGRPNLADYPYERRHTGTRGHIAGYPRREDRMPPNLSSEDVIKHYPNHLQGDVLLGIAENWAPTEIERYFGKPDVLKSNTLVKRINAEKMKRGLLPPRPPVQRAPRPRRRE